MIFDCDLILDSGELICSRCGWGKGRGIVRPVRRNCPMPLEISEELGALIRQHKPDCNIKASRQIFAERLLICESCEQRRGIGCGEVGLLLEFVASRRAHQCPLEKWPVVMEPSSLPPASGVP